MKKPEEAQFINYEVHKLIYEAWDEVDEVDSILSEACESFTKGLTKAPIIDVVAPPWYSVTYSQIVELLEKRVTDPDYAIDIYSIKIRVHEYGYLAVRGVAKYLPPLIDKPSPTHSAIHYLERAYKSFKKLPTLKDTPTAEVARLFELRVNDLLLEIKRD